MALLVFWNLDLCPPGGALVDLPCGLELTAFLHDPAWRRWPELPVRRWPYGLRRLGYRRSWRETGVPGALFGSEFAG